MVQFPNVQAVIYDLDGTLLDTEEFHRRAWELASQEFDLGFSGERIYLASKGISSKRTLENILPAERREIIEPAAEAKFKYMMGLMRDGAVELFPGFMETFEALQHTYAIPVGICTSARQENVEALRQNQGSPISVVLELLEGKVTWKEMSKQGKPSAEPLRISLGQLGGIDPQSAVYVGDAHADYLCAQNAGAGFVYYCPQQRDPTIPLTVPVISDHRELLPYLGLKAV